jgi:plasmid stabilization system protein ParE
LKAKFRGNAKAEYHAAFSYYAANNAEVAARFAEAVRRTIQMIEASPLIARPVLGAHDPRTRKLRVVDFPYYIVFVPLKTRISIVAIRHCRQRPAYGL